MDSVQIQKLFELLPKISFIRKIHDTTVDGSQTEDFHRNCDHVSETLIVFKSGDMIAGLYTNKNWSADVAIKYVDKFFFFSVNHKKLYFPQKERVFMACRDSYHPTVRCCLIRLFGN